MIRRTITAALTAALAVLGASAAMASTNLVTNPDFGPANGGVGYGAVPGWTQAPLPSTLGGFPYLTGSNSSGEQFWNNGTTPAGVTTTGFIQVYPGSATDSLVQTLSLNVGTTYDFSFLENARAQYATPLVEVLINGSQLVAQHVDSSVGGDNAFRLVTGTFTATSSSEDLEFLVSQQSGSDDATALVTAVNVSSAAPEPASWALMLVGFGGMGAALRSRRRRPAVSNA